MNVLNATRYATEDMTALAERIVREVWGDSVEAKEDFSLEIHTIGRKMDRGEIVVATANSTVRSGHRIAILGITPPNNLMPPVLEQLSCPTEDLVPFEYAKSIATAMKSAILRAFGRWDISYEVEGPVRIAIRTRVDKECKEALVRTVLLRNVEDARVAEAACEHRAKYEAEKLAKAIEKRKRVEQVYKDRTGKDP